MDEILDRIKEVFAGFDDFKRKGLPYVAFVIRQDLEDMEEDNWDEEESITELADIIINSSRAMYERGYDPEEVIMNRLEENADKDLDDKMNGFIEEFEKEYED